MQNSGEFLNMIERKNPHAVAVIRGSREYPEIFGTAHLYQTRSGVIVTADVQGLPHDEAICGGKVFGFHIHEGSLCTGNAEDPFADAGQHFNPDSCEHPQHAGDLPPLFENHGRAFMMFLTDRFAVSDVIGRVFIIHAMPDDFKTQPSGDSGMKIACGKVVR